MSNTFARLSLTAVVYLSLGFSSVAQADMKWFETMRGFCPTVCQGTDYKFAVPSGIHSVTGKTFYMCAVDYARTGWRGGYNIEWGSHKCFAQWVRTGGKNSYREHYFCLCADTEIPLITDDMVKR
jgi:hypothetical protein